MGIRPATQTVRWVDGTNTEYDASNPLPLPKTNSIARLLSAAATTNATVAKAGPGNLFKIRGLSKRASDCFLKLYNKASAPTVGTDVPFDTVAIPANSAFDISWVGGCYYSAGISYAITGAIADADTTALAAGDIIGLSISYA